MTDAPGGKDRDGAMPWVRHVHTINVPPFLRDHRFDGKTIYPAVEILRDLAVTVRRHRPGCDVTAMGAAAFDRFLEIGPDDREIEVLHDLREAADGRVSARLLTVSPAGKTGIRREKNHAVAAFGAPETAGPSFPFDLAASLEGICFRIPAERLYAELVPFGSSYRSLRGEVLLSESGGIARVRAPDVPAPPSPLGSPFPLDGMMHIACAWSQRYRGITAFPVGFAGRAVHRPTVPGETYCCRILPVAAAGDTLRFDMAIHDEEGMLREFIREVSMRDVSGGRIMPPAWVREDRADPLADLRRQCRGLIVVEDGAVFGFADRALSEAEAARYAGMGVRRRRGYLAGRLALKALARLLAGNDRRTPAESLHTVAADGVRPFCPDPAGGKGVCCSLSHDRRFAVAVAADGAIGVDVETLSDRALKARHLFLGEGEPALVEASPLGLLAATLRVWSVKEGVTKAAGMPIGEAWRRVRVTHLGTRESRLTVAGEPFAAFHATVGDHLFTLVKAVSG